MATNAIDPARPANGYKWWVVFMLWFVCLFNYADRQAISGVLPKLGEEFGFDKFQQGLIGSAFAYVYAFGAPLAGVIADRVKRKHLILGGCVFWSLVTMATGWCSRFWHFVTVRALEGFGETFYMPASLSLVSDYHGKGTRSKALSIHQSSVYIGTIAGGGLAGWFAQHYDWRYGFYFFGGAGLVLALVLYAFLREPRRGQAEAEEKAAADGPPAELLEHEVADGPKDAPHLTLRETFAAVFRAPMAVVLMLAFLAANFVATIFLIWTPTYLVEKFGFKLAAAAFLGPLFIHAASAFGAPLGGVLADRFALNARGGRMLVQAIGLVAGSLMLFFIGGTSDVKTLFASLALFGFAKGLYDSNIFASLYDFVEPRARASAAGLMNTIGWGGGAFGPVYIGYATEHGSQPTKIDNMSVAIANCGYVYLLAAALMIVAIVMAHRSGSMKEHANDV